MSYSHGQRQEKSRLPPNLRSTHRSLLDGRAIVHLVTECMSCGGRKRGSHAGDCGADTGHLSANDYGVIELCAQVIQYGSHSLDFRNPICYSAFQRGQVVSACLLRSPVSSDCTFIPEGCSVSSRYTFPKGLGSVLSALFSSVKTIPVF